VDHWSLYPRWLVAKDHSRVALRVCFKVDRDVDGTVEEEEEEEEARQVE